MDLDGDGNTDILSGSYSRHGQDMAGLFQVLRGRKDGTFAAAEVLNGADGQPLLLPVSGSDDDVDIDRICTRAFAADLDGDEKLDLVSGNFRGAFALFAGQGGGRFDPRATWLQSDGHDVHVDYHGDPFLVDWDGDGDLDLLSGSSKGGAFLFPNEGSRTAPSFGRRTTLVEPVGEGVESDALGDGHLTGPGSDTRLWAADLNGDAKLDLLLGDNVTLYHAQDGVSADVAQEKLRAWRAAVAELDPEAEDWGDRYGQLEKQREPFVREDRTGFVWVLYRK